MGNERYPKGAGEGEVLQPGEIPRDLAYFLKDHDYACVTHATEQGTAYVIKAPAEDLVMMGDRVPLAVRHELFSHPRAPVIRTIITIFDRLEQPLRLETFINVAEEDQRSDFARLAEQDEVYLLFYDEDSVNHRTIGTANRHRTKIPRFLAEAEKLRVLIPPDQYDFDAAKADIMAQNTLA